MPQLTIFTVATDRYLDFWLDLMSSANKFVEKSLIVQWIVFTNREKDIPPVLKRTLGGNLLVVEFESVPWPMPTLLRYELLVSVSDKVKGSVVMHLDADMLFVKNLSLEDLENSIGGNKVALIKHPGFYRPRNLSRLNFYLKHPVFVMRDLKSVVINGGLGSWETHPNSLAYVERKLRKNYVCGGVWFGKKDAVIQLCELLGNRIKSDLSRNVIARFHDESHLNWYAVNNEVSTINPEFCFEPSYPQLNQIVPTIIAVDKGRGSEWQR